MMGLCQDVWYAGGDEDVSLFLSLLLLLLFLDVPCPWLLLVVLLPLLLLWCLLVLVHLVPCFFHLFLLFLRNESDQEIQEETEKERVLEQEGLEWYVK